MTEHVINQPTFRDSRLRSPAYVAGVKAGTDSLVDRRGLAGMNPYDEGSAESDAWLSGTEEGRRWPRRCFHDGYPCSNEHCDSCERK